jgi:NAD(P)-dependent dehydrogenase (short-subunit alcohol dehydrogenase family)
VSTVARTTDGLPAGAGSDRFAGQVALVTGGGKGIGEAISLRLAAEGADVAINYRSDAVAAEATAQRIRALGRRALLVPADVTDPDAAEAMVAAVEAELGAIGLLVNNAAYTRMVPPEQMTLKMWRRIFAANMDAAFHITWLVLDGMRAAGAGGIVNISSTEAFTPNPNMIAYGASKAALNAFTASASLAVVKDGIRINAVAPGFTRTPRVDTVPAAQQAELITHVPIGRMAESEEIASVVAFLLSDEASYITGEIISVAGGPR